MQAKPEKTRLSAVTTWMQPTGRRRAVIVALALLCSILLPAVAIFLGVFLLAAVAVHAWSPSLQPFVQPLLRVPVGRPATRYARLLVFAGAAILLVLSGSVGATVRGHLRSRGEGRAMQREAEDQHLAQLLERAREQLSAGSVEGAELVLLDAEAMVATDSEQRAELDELLERVRLCRDPQAILAILSELPQKELDAFEQGEVIPQALEFPEQALTARAVEIALGQIDRAQQLRTRP
jgi:hypothetical protein